MNSTQTEQKTKKQSAPQTPKRRENSRRKEQRTRHGNTLTALYHKIPYHYVLGDFLYMVGFWVEYTLVRTWRRLREALQSIGAALGQLRQALAGGDRAALEEMFRLSTRRRARFDK